MWLTMKPQGTLQYCPTALLGLLGCAWSMLPPSLRSLLLLAPAFMQLLVYSMLDQHASAIFGSLQAAQLLLNGLCMAGLP